MNRPTEKNRRALRRPRLGWIRTGSTLIVVLGALIGCGADGDGSERARQAIETIPRLRNNDPGKPENDLRLVRWRVSHVVNGNAVAVYSSSGYCQGERPPEFAGYRSRTKKNSRFIMVFISKARDSHKSDETICRSVGFVVRGVLRFSQPVQTLRLYDSSVDPPRLRWP
jgi:hypothetical protein